MSEEISIDVVEGESPQQQLMRMKDFTKRFGGLHESQVFQIKIWTHAFFDVKATFAYNHEIRKVFVQLHEISPIFDTEQCDVFQSWLRWLLGDDVTLAVGLKPPGDDLQPSHEVFYGNFKDWPA